ncbi:PIG-L deacetylase family protein [Sphingomonas qilianensis]|uniref:PIG-L family deacetylase n=1 Tax=Sphingomonas qilianensis TaxID=1736690 RepID=A0ABU9XUQ9_9SPHN
MPNPRHSALFRQTSAQAVLRLAGRRCIVVVAPHPDDETLGCGLLIARATRAGARIAVVALTDGQASHPGSRRWPAAALGRLRRAELRRAMARLGAAAARCVYLGWPDGQVAQRGKVGALRRVLQSLDPGVVIAASPADHHPDHKAGWARTRAALRGTGVPLVAYAVWSRTTGGGPAARDPGKAAKRWAIAAHRSQTSDYIADDPQGFTLSPAVLAALVDEAERFTLASRGTR